MRPVWARSAPGPDETGGQMTSAAQRDTPTGSPAFAVEDVTVRFAGLTALDAVSPPNRTVTSSTAKAGHPVGVSRCAADVICPPVSSGPGADRAHTGRIAQSGPWALSTECDPGHAALST